MEVEDKEDVVVEVGQFPTRSPLGPDIPLHSRLALEKSLQTCSLLSYWKYSAP